MKTLLAAATIALTFASGGLTAHAQGPIPPPPGGGFPGREFRPPGPGYAPGAPGARDYRNRRFAPYVIPPEARHFPPPPYGPPPPPPRPPLAGLLRFIFER